MRTVVPSQVCAFIEREFASKQGQFIGLSDQICGSLRGLIGLVAGIPPALMPSDDTDFVAVISSVEYIKHHLNRAETLGTSEHLAYGDLPLPPSTGSEGLNPVRVIEHALQKFPDEASPVASRDLLFIRDPEIRIELLSDLTSARSALLNSEWKPATVITGSLAEALLLWATDQKSEDLPAACTAAIANGANKKALSRESESWGLQELIAVAAELGVIEQDTKDQLKLAQGFRNLIHPGRAR